MHNLRTAGLSAAQQYDQRFLTTLDSSQLSRTEQSARYTDTAQRLEVEVNLINR